MTRMSGTSIPEIDRLQPRIVTNYAANVGVGAREGIGTKSLV